MPASLQDCRERFIIVEGDLAAVRRRVPGRFTLRLSSAGRPLLYVSAISCERYTAGGVTKPTVVAAFGASIESPDGRACGSTWPAVGGVRPDLVGSCNNYLLFAAYDQPHVVSWARRGAGGVPAHHVPGLRFDEHLVAAHASRLVFGAPPPTPSPFILRADVRPRPAATTLTGAFWHDDGTHLVRFGFEADDFAMGEASGEVEAQHGSEMAALMGSQRAHSTTAFAQMGGAQWTRAVMHRTVTSST